MPLYVNTNVPSQFAQRQLGRNQAASQKSLERLSTGLRINSAADDAAGLAISNKFRSQIRSLEQSARNASDGISVIQTAEGALDQMGEILTRMRELGIQSANGSLTDTDRTFINGEFQSLASELNRIAETTDFNGRRLLNGSASAGIAFQVGPGNTSNDRISVSIANTQASQLGTAGTKLNTQGVSTVTKSQNALGIIDAAITQISNTRSNLGASQNRLTVTIDNIGTSVENLAAANARIRDVDVARETASLTRAQILVQAGVSVLAQANQAPQIALSLLG
jgi:flagellin